MSTEPARIRTVGIAGQGGVGKTSVADALVFAAGGNNRLGRVDDESSVFDTEPEETRRRCTITSSLFTVPWNKVEVTIVDTPGQGNFINDSRFALRAVGSMLFVVDPTSPLRAESAKVWSWARAEQLSTLILVNRLDRSEADVEGTLTMLASELGARPVMLYLPVGKGESFTGVADVMAGKAVLYDGESGKFSVEDASAELVANLAEAKAQLMEAAAESNDELLERYLDSGELSDDDIREGLKLGVRDGKVALVACASSAKNVGFPQVLAALVQYVPPPVELPPARAKDAAGADVEVAPDPAAPFGALVVKTIVDPHAGQLSVLRVMSGKLTSETPVVNTRTGAKERIGNVLRLEGRKTSQGSEASVGELVAVAKLKDTHRGDSLADASRPVTFAAPEPFHPVISFAIEAKKRGEEDKAVQGLHRLSEEDPALVVERDESTGEILVSGAGQLHVEVACERLARKYGVEVNLKAPKVPYRETIRKSVKAHGRLKKQTGGHGQFADCWIEVEPLARGAGFEFVDKVVGGSIPRGFIPAVEKGVVESMKHGSIARHPVVDVRVTLYDGQYHDVDSSEMAFKIAGSMAFKEALSNASPVLLEPYVSLTVTAPDDCMGDVMGDLNARRGKVEGMEQRGHSEVIKAKVPMVEVLRYAPDLTSMTSGRGSFEMGFSHYEPLPDHLVAKVVQESGASKAE